MLSVDRENDADTIAMIGASAALQVSDIPFRGPIAGVRIGRLRGALTVNPLQSQFDQSDINLFVAAGRDAIIMVEGGAKAASEEDMLEALFLAQDAVKPILDAQDELARIAGKPKREFVAVPADAALASRVRELAAEKLRAGLTVTGKHERHDAVAAVKKEVKAALAEDYVGREKEVHAALEELESETLRTLVVRENRRVDGRGLTDIRPITCEVGILPRTHGSALFTRGETQALVVATLGTSSDEQKVDALIGEQFKRFMLHYNFPPFSVGEARPLRSPGRREIGHGALAERALQAVVPEGNEFPYTIRVVSEVLESNGSSSMATVCGGTLSLMDAGVPIKAPVAGIAMGLIKEGEEIRILSDILGDEDHLGDMDFKVAGTADGITALQMVGHRRRGRPAGRAARQAARRPAARRRAARQALRRAAGARRRRHVLRRPGRVHRRLPVHPPDRPLALRPGAEGDPRERAARHLARLRRRPLQAARLRPLDRAGRPGRFAEDAGARLRDAVGRALVALRRGCPDDSARRHGHFRRAGPRRVHDHRPAEPALRPRRRVGHGHHRRHLRRLRRGVPARLRRRAACVAEAPQVTMSEAFRRLGVASRKPIQESST